MFTFVTSRRTGRTVTTLALIAALAAGGTVTAACSDEEEMVTTSEYEDCDPEDQGKKEDDCGYWQKGSEVHVGAQPDMTWFWIWYTWVVIGQTSRPPANWAPPRGVKPPMRTIQVPKSKVCAMAAPAPPRPPAPAPRVNTPPRVNNPAPKAPVNKNPAQPRPRGC